MDTLKVSQSLEEAGMSQDQAAVRSEILHLLEAQALRFKAELHAQTIRILLGVMAINGLTLAVARWIF